MGRAADVRGGARYAGGGCLLCSIACHARQTRRSAASWATGPETCCVRCALWSRSNTIRVSLFLALMHVESSRVPCADFNIWALPRLSFIRVFSITGLGTLSARDRSRRGIVWESMFWSATCRREQWGLKPEGQGIWRCAGSGRKHCLPLVEAGFGPLVRGGSMATGPAQVV